MQHAVWWLQLPLLWHHIPWRRPTHRCVSQLPVWACVCVSPRAVHLFYSPTIGKFRWTYDGVFVDLDGSLAGSPSKILPWTDTLDPDKCTKDSRFSVGAAAGAVEGAICDPSMKFARISFNKWVVFAHLL